MQDSELMVIDDGALAAMRKTLHRPGRWAAYQNRALDSCSAGHLVFLVVGPEYTYAEPPKTYPADTVAGAGWRYLFVGFVNLEAGEVECE